MFRYNVLAITTINRSLRNIGIAIVAFLCAPYSAESATSASSSGSCMQGTWRANKEAMMALMQSTITVMQPTITTGSMTFIFSADNKFSQTIDRTTVVVKTPGIPSTVMEITYHGTILGTYTKEGSKYRFGNFKGDGLQVDSITLDGQQFSRSAIPLDKNELFLNSDSQLTISCNVNFLALTWAMGNRTAKLALHRLLK